MIKKFRVWDNENNRYFEPVYEAYKGKVEELVISLTGRLALRTMTDLIDESMFPNRFILEQYIGLNDKNGKEIYEGDLINEGYGSPSKIEYGSFNCSCCDGVYGWEFTYADIRNIERCLVVGNIHELMED